MKNKYLILSFLTLVCLNVYFLFITRSNKQRIVNLAYTNQLYKEKNTILKTDYETLKESSSLSIQSSAKNNILQIDNSLDKSKKYLVIRLHHNDCNDCVNNSVKIIEKYKSKLSNYTIIVCADYPTQAAYKSEFPNVKYPVLIKNSLSSDLGNISNPYIFTYEPSTMEIDNIYFPNWKLMDVFETYIKSL